MYELEEEHNPDSAPAWTAVRRGSCITHIVGYTANALHESANTNKRPTFYPDLKSNSRHTPLTSEWWNADAEAGPVRIVHIHVEYMSHA